MILIAGALEAQAGALVCGKVQPEQSGAVKVPFAEELVGPVGPLEDPADPSKLSPPLLPGRHNPVQPPSSLMPPLVPPLLVPPPPPPSGKL
jgi:hypothetical protein